MKYRVRKECEDFLSVNANGLITGKNLSEGSNRVPGVLIYIDGLCIGDASAIDVDVVEKYNWKGVYALSEDEDRVTGVDKKTNVQFSTPKDVVPEDTVLDVKEITDETTLNQIRVSLQDTSTKYVTYDITLKSNNVAIQPNGKVQISIPIPKDFDKNNLAVYRIENNGNKIAYEVTVKTIGEQDYAVFETDHFSNYVLAEKTLEGSSLNNEQEQANQRILDNEPKTGMNTSVEALVSTLALVSLAIVISTRKN